MAILQCAKSSYLYPPVKQPSSDPVQSDTGSKATSEVADSKADVDLDDGSDSDDEIDAPGPSQSVDSKPSKPVVPGNTFSADGREKPEGRMSPSPRKEPGREYPSDDEDFGGLDFIDVDVEALRNQQWTEEFERALAESLKTPPAPPVPAGGPKTPTAAAPPIPYNEGNIPEEIQEKARQIEAFNARWEDGTLEANWKEKNSGKDLPYVCPVKLCFMSVPVFDPVSHTDAIRHHLNFTEFDQMIERATLTPEAKDKNAAKELQHAELVAAADQDEADGEELGLDYSVPLDCPGCRASMHPANMQIDVALQDEILNWLKINTPAGDKAL